MVIKMKKICKITIIFLIILYLFSINFNVYAAKYNVDDGGSQGIWDTGKHFLNMGKDGYSNYDAMKVRVSFSKIVGFLWGLGLLTVFISTVVIGIKYMLVNPNEKSRIKQATTPYIIGVVVIFGAVTIWKLVIDVLEGSMLK